VDRSSPVGADGVAHRRELARRGVSVGCIRRAIAAGRWQEPVPGVVVAHGGPLTRRQRWLVGLAHGRSPRGERLVHPVSGAATRLRAEHEQCARVREAARIPRVEVSVPHGRHLGSSGFVVVHQTRRPVRPVLVDGLRLAEAARSAVDVAQTADRRSDVDHVISHVLQRRLTEVEALVAETVALGRSATPWLRAAIRDAARGMRSVGEADLRRVVVRAGLPEPEWNAPVETPQGTYFVDALWRRQRVAAEADGAAFHLSSEDWERDLRRQNALQATDLRLLRFPVRRLRGAPDDCGAEMWALVG
jgi:very-short-patch-repair endonuclease